MGGGLIRLVILLNCFKLNALQKSGTMCTLLSPALRLQHMQLVFNMNRLILCIMGTILFEVKMTIFKILKIANSILYNIIW